MKMIYIALCFLQLVCSNHFLVETETEDDHEEPRMSEDYHGSGFECMEAGIDYAGNDFKKISNIPSAEECACACGNHNKCLYFTWSGKSKFCWLKHSYKGRKRSHSQAFSGSKYCCKGFECIEARIDYAGNDFKKISNIPSAEECACACGNHDRCLYFTWSDKTKFCWL